MTPSTRRAGRAAVPTRRRAATALAALAALAVVPLASATGASGATSAPDVPPAEASPTPQVPDPDDAVVAEPEPDTLTLTLTDVAPAVLGPEDMLVLSGTLTNTTDEALVDPTLRLGVQRAVPTSRLAMERWFDPVSGPTSRTAVTAPYPVRVEPGATAPFSFSVPVADLGFPIRHDNWGARGLEVSLAGSGLETTARTVGVFFPSQEEVLEQDVRLSLVLPLTPSAQEWTDALEQDVPVADVAGERVRALVEGSGDAVTWALDPALLGEAPALQHLGEVPEVPDQTASPGATPDPSATPDDGATPGGDAGGDVDDAEGDTDETTGGTPATEEGTGTPDDTDVGTTPTAATTATGPLAQDLTDAVGDREVLALPWADADLPGLAGAGEVGGELLTDARVAALEVFATSGFVVDASTAWPASPDVSREAVRAAVTAGYTGVLLDGVAAPDPELVYAPTARTDVAGVAPVPALVADPSLSAAVSGAEPPGSTGASPELASRQYALALSAVLVRENVPDRHALVLVDREVAGDAAGADAVGARVDALLDVPWVEATSVADALAAQPGTELRGALPDEGVRSASLDRVAARVGDGLTTLEGLTGALSQPESLDDVAAVLRTATASAWRTQEDLAGAALPVDVGWGEIDRYGRAVTVTVTESLLSLLAEEAEVPVTVTNTLDVPLTVDIAIVPAQPALRVPDQPSVTLAPLEQRRIRVPITAIANGQTSVDVRVLSPDGTPMSSGATFDVRVRAEWESVGTGIVAAGLGVLLVIGLVRTFRRGRRNSEGIAPGTPAARVADDDHDGDGEPGVGEGPDGTGAGDHDSNGGRDPDDGDPVVGGPRHPEHTTTRTDEHEEGRTR